MVYATATGVRTLTGLTTSDISDADLTSLGVIADKQVLRDVSVRIILEEMEGTIDGTNKEFRAKNREFCDTNYDSAVNASDVTVYTMDVDATTGFEEYTSVTVSSVSTINRIVTLSTAPATSVDGVYINYSFAVPNLDYAQVVQAANLYTGYLALTQILSANASTESYRIGKLSIDQGSKVSAISKRAEELYQRYFQLIKYLNPGLTYIVTGEKMQTFQTANRENYPTGEE